MRQAVLRVGGLPPAPLDAAAAFHRHWLCRARTLLAQQQDVALLFAPAPHPHQAWRLAAVQELAREAAPLRVNAVAGEAGPESEELLAWLAEARAITGQVLLAAGNPAGEA